MSSPDPAASEPVRLLPGDPAPGFIQRSVANPRYAFDSAAGRYLVLCFYGSASDAHTDAALQAAYARTDHFDDARACFFGVSVDPRDEAEGRVANRMPGYRHFWDFDLVASRLYGVVPKDAAPGSGPIALARHWFVIDPTMRVIAAVPFRADRGDIAEVMAVLDDLPPPERFAGIDLQAPIIFLPRVFEPELCRHLIGLYEEQGGEESGFMREVDGRTVGVTDASFKRRKDYNIADRALIGQLQGRFLRRVIPEIAKVHQFKATRMERYIVSCYAAEDGGHFSAHRDNTTKGTAHRRFAVSVNLNDDFDGGEVNFPEYGPRSFKAPPGGAVVFSCSLLHKVSRVRRGRRYAFLPFLYDDQAARIREANMRYLGTQEGQDGAAAKPAAEPEA
ncbi:peroxiredoxin [Acuticoccus sediminis]|uniref:Peroxiredoxin n=1 Tax=Acuticoccus sediminis TaxID=2184697 RepID=A0A8B2NQP6_9HYPH|nr:2OG-Fe(II) oxygenase [Acuticoccus sediminis]RAH97319.1 peroxiredoxin [Acuticoccus sediminis]